MENRLTKYHAGIEEYFEDLDRRYPDRHKQIHKTCCKQCPSTKGEDEESVDIKASVPKEHIAREYLFVCAWRESKLCKGYCDYNDIDQEYLDNLYKK